MDNNKRPNPMASPGFVKFFKFSLIAVLVLLSLYIYLSCGKREQTDFDNIDLVQYGEFANDTDVVVFETSMGTFKAVLFPDKAPEYCEYFKDLVNSGYYNGTYVCNIVNGTYFTGGTKSADGMSTEDSDMTAIEAEVSPDLWPFKGALGSFYKTEGVWIWKKNMAGSGVMFFNDSGFDDDEILSLDEANKNITNAFVKYRGVPEASQEYTIFGQVCDGWEVYNKICKAQVKDSEEDDYQPKDDIKFNKVYMSTWGEQQPVQGTADPSVLRADSNAEENADKTSANQKAKEK